MSATPTAAEVMHQLTELALDGYSAAARRRASNWATSWLTTSDVIENTSGSALGKALFLLGAADLLSDFEHYVYGQVDFEHAIDALRTERP